MNVLVVNSSPKPMELSITKQLTAQFAAGMEEAGASVKVYDLKNMSIHYCADCGSCATVSLGKCVMADDMTNILYPAFLEADVMVLSTPIYFGMMNSLMKKFIERLFPYLGPWQEACQNKVKQDFRGIFPKIVVISAASWHCNEAFTQLSGYIHYLFNDQVVFEMYRGDSDSLCGNVFYDKKSEIYKGAKAAGAELVQNGYVTDKTKDSICQDIASVEKTVLFHNLILKMCKEENVNTTQYRKKRINDNGTFATDSMESFMDMVYLMHNAPDKDWEIKIQIIAKGKERECGYFDISKGEIQYNLDVIDNPDLTIKASKETLVNLVCRKDNLINLIMKGKVIAKGKIEELNKVNACLFAG